MDNIQIDPSETIVLKLRKHWVVFLRDILGTVIIGAVPFLFFGLASFLGIIPGWFIIPEALMNFTVALWGLLIWMAVFAIWTDGYLDLWVITDRRIINLNQIGLFDRKVTTIDMQHIQEVTTKMENPMQVFFGYGALEVQTAGPTDEYAKIEGIPNPEAARVAILQHAEVFSRLEEANRNQEGFLHAFSHEIKGYLTKDEAALSSIAESDAVSIPSDVKSIANKALSETRKGVDTVMEILDASNFKTGVMRMDKKVFDMKIAIFDIAGDMRPIADSKKLSFEVIVEDGTYTVEGDEAKLRRHVLRNLIENALHYTQVGGIRVLLSKTAEQVVFSVKDTGVGISKEDMNILFTEGGRGKNSAAVNAESTGYGLFVAKTVVDAHGGRIWAESEGEGKGSQFFVELPAMT